MMTDPLSPPDPEAIVPDHELVFRASRSGGPGGQHVNTSSTRVEVKWNVFASTAVSDVERSRLIAKLGKRLDSRGWLRVVSERSRSQHANREDAADRLRALVVSSLRVPKKRKRTRIPVRAREQRLEEKRRRGERKRERGARPDRD